MLLNPPSPYTRPQCWHCLVCDLVVRTLRTKAVSPTCVPDFRFSGSAESGSKHYDWDPPFITFVVLLPSFANRFPSASCTFTSLSLGAICLLCGWVHLLYLVHVCFLPYFYTSMYILIINHRLTSSSWYKSDSFLVIIMMFLFLHCFCFVHQSESNRFVLPVSSKQ